ncbi:Hypothetical predicted protein [Octopus vulgaris]|uniref:Uncharacterized protein n=1 Tax=Octopus vulgaris TaxID=6645 RepID=A0AA36AI27_OCTVU|nr:Hypothetical predicted protein [Octopus vulgaris]
MYRSYVRNNISDMLSIIVDSSLGSKVSECSIVVGAIANISTRHHFCQVLIPTAINYSLFYHHPLSVNLQYLTPYPIDSSIRMEIVLRVSFIISTQPTYIAIKLKQLRNKRKQETNK